MCYNTANNMRTFLCWYVSRDDLYHLHAVFYPAVIAQESSCKNDHKRIADKKDPESNSLI